MPSRDKANFSESRKPRSRQKAKFSFPRNRDQHSTFFFIWNNAYWLKSIWSIISVVSSGRFVRNRIWFGGCSPTGPITENKAIERCNIPYNFYFKNWPIKLLTLLLHLSSKGSDRSTSSWCLLKIVKSEWSWFPPYALFGYTSSMNNLPFHPLSSSSSWNHPSPSSACPRMFLSSWK